jgi:hypothetical protein
VEGAKRLADDVDEDVAGERCWLRVGFLSREEERVAAACGGTKKLGLLRAGGCCLKGKEEDRWMGRRRTWRSGSFHYQIWGWSSRGKDMVVVAACFLWKKEELGQGEKERELSGLVSVGLEK